MKVRHLHFLYVLITVLSSCSVDFLTEHDLSLASNHVESINLFKSSKSFFSSPIATKNNHVVIGGHDRSIYFFNETGELLSSYKTDGWVHASPSLLKDGTVAIGSYDGYIYFFSENGELKNRIKPGSGSVFTSIIELPNRLLVFGSNKRGIVFFNQHDSTSHIYPVKKWVHGTPSLIGKDKIAIGSNDKHIYILTIDANLQSKVKTKGWIMHSAPIPVNNSSFAIGSYDKNLYIIDNNGRSVSSFKTKGRIHGTPLTTANSNIVFGSFDRFIYFLKTDGTLFKKFKTRKKVVSSPVALKDGTIVVGSYDKNLYFFSQNGIYLGSYKTKGKIFSTPIVLDNNTLVVCTTNGYIEFLKVKPNFVNLESNFFRY
jgi:outer membrane protein assembly factor BamB